MTVNMIRKQVYEVRSESFSEILEKICILISMEKPIFINSNSLGQNFGKKLTKCDPTKKHFQIKLHRKIII